MTSKKGLRDLLDQSQLHYDAVQSEGGPCQEE